MNATTQLFIASELVKAAGRGEVALRAFQMAGSATKKELENPLVQGVLHKQRVPGLSGEEMTHARNYAADSLRALRATKGK